MIDKSKFNYVKKFFIGLVYIILAVLYSYYYGFRFYDKANIELVVMVLCAVIAAATFGSQFGKRFTACLCICMVAMAYYVAPINASEAAELKKLDDNYRLSTIIDKYEKGVAILSSDKHLSAEDYEEAAEAFSSSDYFAHSDLTSAEIRDKAK